VGSGISYSGRSSVSIFLSAPSVAWQLEKEPEREREREREKERKREREKERKRERERARASFVRNNS
jgi:hypothetical protein